MQNSFRLLSHSEEDAQSWLQVFLGAHVLYRVQYWPAGHVPHLPHFPYACTGWGTHTLYSEHAPNSHSTVLQSPPHLAFEADAEAASAASSIATGTVLNILRAAVGGS
jgi:hypothetical protein